MKLLLIGLAVLLAVFIVFQWCFMVYGSYQEMKKRGPIPKMWYLGIGTAFVLGGAIDLAWNLTLGWILFAESPLPLLWDYVKILAYYALLKWIGREKPDTELTFSERIDRHYSESDGWRWTEASFWKRTLNAVVTGHIFKQVKVKVDA